MATKKTGKLVTFILIVFFLTGCASVDITVKEVMLREHQAYAPLKDDDAKGKLLVKLFHLLKKNKNKELKLFETDPGNKKAKESGIRWFVQGGPFPALCKQSSIIFTDVLYIDRENMEIKCKVKSKMTFLFIPLMNPETEAVLSIKSVNEIKLTYSGLYSWLIIGTGIFKFEWLIDYIDFDNNAIGAHYAVGGGGPTSAGGGKGYLLVKFKEKADEGLVVAKAVQPEIKEEEKPAVIPEEQEEEQTPALTASISFNEASGNKVIDGGEKVGLTVEIENKGNGTAKDVQVILSGSQALVNYLGEKKFAGNIKPGEKKRVQFETVVPVDVPAETALIKIEIKEKSGVSPYEQKTLKVAMRPAEKKETVEVISDLPHLVYTTQLKDQNDNRILDGGETVVLTVKIENRGGGAAKDVSVLLSGNPTLVGYLGKKKFVGDIKAGEKKTAQFTAVLPPEVPAETAKITVEIEEKGSSSSKRKTLMVAMRPAELKETVEIISELPYLVYTTRLKDQNNNRILDGGETVVLRVEIQNKGEEVAKDVQVLLSGNPTLVSCLGEKKNVGDLKAGEKKTVVFKAVLPAQIPSETAKLTVQIEESVGFSPSERKTLRVAMRPVKVAETVEVISEVSVDDLPAKTKNYKMSDNFALVIGISKYREKIIPSIKYAGRDAEVTAKYLENLGGIPRSNIKLLTDDTATKSDLVAYSEEWLSRRVKKNSTVYIFYAGHGAPDPQGKEAYIVPYEGHPDFPSKLYPLNKMYESLNRLPAKNVIVMLDSCFSGVQGRSVTSKGTRPISISIENPVLSGGNITVIAGATGNQMSSDYDRVEHGLFTYYLLRGMRGEADKNANGVVELGELYDYVRTNVSEKASLELNRDQTPVLLPSEESAGDKLKIPVAKYR
ncbi:MAG: caspase family protein [Syntrophales bacterium]|nr:caspase family protein [Syntrophales bacterium]